MHPNRKFFIGVFYRRAIAKGQNSKLAGAQTWSLGDQPKEQSDTGYSPKLSMSRTRDTGYPATLWCVALQPLKSDTKCLKSDPSPFKKTVVLRLGNPRSCKSSAASLVCKEKKAWQVCANFHGYKDLMGDARCLLGFSDILNRGPSTRHHNNKWPECNCAPAMLYSTSCSSQKCNNMTPLGNQACISRHRQMLHASSMFKN